MGRYILSLLNKTKKERMHENEKKDNLGMFAFDGCLWTGLVA